MKAKKLIDKKELENIRKKREDILKKQKTVKK